jgi:hypothetical protein
MLGEMKAFVAAALLAAIAVTAAGCGSSHRAATTDALHLHVSPSTSRIPPGLVQEIDSTRDLGHVLRAEVYGPGTRAAFVKASSGAVVQPTGREREERFYLIVLHGHFVANSHPPGTKAPHGTIETQVWSRAEGVTDSGISDRLPAAAVKLHRLAALALS